MSRNVAVSPVVAAAAACVASFALGCDGPADSAALRDLGVVVDARAAGSTDAQLTSDLDRLRGEGNLADPTQALVNLVAGDARLAEADRLRLGDVEGGRAGLLDLQARAVRLSEQLATRASDLATLSTALSRLEVAATAAETGIGAITAKAGEMAGEGTWSAAAGETDPNGPYPGLAGEITEFNRTSYQAYREARGRVADLRLKAVGAVEAEIAEVRGAQETLQAEIGEADARRRDLLARSGGRERQAVTSRGDEAVAAAREVADLGTEAGEIQGTLIVLAGRLEELRRDERLLQSRLTSLQAAAETLRGQADAARQGLQGAGGIETVRRQILDAATDVLRGRSQDDTGMAGLSGELETVRRNADATRADVVEALTSAEQAYADAARRAAAAGGRNTGQGAMPSRALASDAMQAAARSANLGLADVRRQIGETALGRAMVEVGLVRLGTRLQQAPDSLDVSEVRAIAADAATAATQALADAARAFEASIEAATSVSGGDADVRRAATLQQFLALRSYAAALDLAGAMADLTGTPVAADLPDASEVRNRLATLVSEAQQNNIPLPFVPGLTPARPAEEDADFGSDVDATPDEADPTADDAGDVGDGGFEPDAAE